MNRIRVLIVDDEPIARRGVRLQLKGEPEVEIIGECSNGLEAVSAIQKLSPDLVFLDVQLHVGRESHLLRETIGGLAARLDPIRFLRIRNSTIVNLERVKELRPLFRGEYLIVLRDGTELNSSRRYRKNLDAILES